MGFWEGLYPANDALADYPIERYLYWMNSKLIDAEKFENRFLQRGLDANEINHVIKQLSEIRDLIIESDAYYQEKERRQSGLIQS